MFTHRSIIYPCGIIIEVPARDKVYLDLITVNKVSTFTNYNSRNGLR